MRTCLVPYGTSASQQYYYSIAGNDGFNVLMRYDGPIHNNLVSGKRVDDSVKKYALGCPPAIALAIKKGGLPRLVIWEYSAVSRIHRRHSIRDERAHVHVHSHARYNRMHDAHAHDSCRARSRRRDEPGLVRQNGWSPVRGHAARDYRTDTRDGLPRHARVHRRGDRAHDFPDRVRLARVPAQRRAGPAGYLQIFPIAVRGFPARFR